MAKTKDKSEIQTKIVVDIVLLCYLVGSSDKTGQRGGMETLIPQKSFRRRLVFMRTSATGEVKKKISGLFIVGSVC